MGFFGNKDKDDLEKVKNNEESSEEEEEEETYSYDFECENCGSSGEDTYRIPKGILVETYLQDKICEECGCPVKTK